MRVLVADDEPPARRRLVRMLADLGGTDVVAEVDSGDAILAATVRTDPDLLLLDIDMPGATGLDVARALGGDRLVVFVTAHHEHAVDAFDLEAVDYLLKPVSGDRLAEALRRARLRQGRPARLVTHAAGRTHLFDTREVTRFWAIDGYSGFAVDGTEHFTLESLSTLEERLADFVRVHRAHLVRRDVIRSLSLQTGAASADLRDGSTVPVSRRMVGRLKRELGL